MAAACLTFASPVAAQDEPVATRLVDVRAEPDQAAAVPKIVDRLAPNTVLTVRAVGFPADRTATVRQCVVGDRRHCANEIRVRFDHDGTATFQYLITDVIGSTVGDGRCRLADASLCTVEIRVGGSVATIDTVFVDIAPPAGTIEVSPADGIEIGRELTVTATGFPADTHLGVTICAAPAHRGPRCGSPGPELQLTTDATGAASGLMVLETARVGSDGVACGRRTICRVVVSSDALGVRAQPVTLEFRESPGADYDRGRVGAGLLLALAFVAAAVSLVRRTDWAAPPEADGSPIDEAEFADLDREAELFEETAAR